MEKISTIIALAIVIVGTGAIILMGANGAMSGQEEFECNQWQSQAKTYENFYITKWQKAQCDHYNITIEAPVY